METKTYVVVASIGRDRPGLVYKVSHEIRKNGGNIEKQRSTKMAGDFAATILFSLENTKEEEVDFVIESLNKLCDEEFFIFARRAPSGSTEIPPGSICGDLTATGEDQEGLIEAVTLSLLQRDINIGIMEYDITNAPMTGTPLFRMKASVAVPESFNIAGFKKELRDIEQRWNIDTLFEYPVPCQD